MMKKTISRRERDRMHKQHWDWLKFIALCALAGITAGVIAAAIVIRFDINNLGSLLARSPNRLGYTFLLTAGFASTFGMVAMGLGITIRSHLQD